jgi:hypothetical protein
MPRYLIERTLLEGMVLPGPSQGLQARQEFLANNALAGVTWVFSYVAPDHRRSFCIYDAPTPEALRQAAQRNGLPVDRITEVCMLDPYCSVPKS